MKSNEEKLYKKILKCFENVEFSGATNLLATLNPSFTYTLRHYKNEWCMDCEEPGQGELLKPWLVNGFCKFIDLSSGRTLILKPGGKIEIVNVYHREILSGETKTRYQHRVLFPDSENCYCLLPEIEELVKELQKND